jgi:hypothetical protein
VHQVWVNAGWQVKGGVNAIKTHKVIFSKKKLLLKKSILLHDIFVYFNCPFPHNAHNKKQLESVYEKMMSQYDPSKLKDMDMAQELIDLAEAKTREMKEMYEKALLFFKAALKPKY